MFPRWIIVDFMTSTLFWRREINLSIQLSFSKFFQTSAWGYINATLNRRLFSRWVNIKSYFEFQDILCVHSFCIMLGQSMTNYKDSFQNCIYIFWRTMSSISKAMNSKKGADFKTLYFSGHSVQMALWYLVNAREPVACAPVHPTRSEWLGRYVNAKKELKSHYW